MPDDRVIFKPSECESASLIKGKNTVIMATCQSSMHIFMTSVLSAVINSNPSTVEHFMVCINGGDDRTESTALQDRKQAFLEELRRSKWHGRDMPLTVVRVWSRIGHTQSVEMAIPWVHTEFYTIMHDDVIITKEDWAESAEAKLSMDRVAMCKEAPVLQMSTNEVKIDGKDFVNLPHINSSFCVCRKSDMTEIGQRWYGYHFLKEFVIKDTISPERFMENHAEWAGDDKFVSVEKSYEGLSIDVGGFIWSAAIDKGYRIECFDESKSVHLIGMSWCDEKVKNMRLEQHKDSMARIRQKISEHPELERIYEKYRRSNAELL